MLDISSKKSEYVCTERKKHTITEDKKMSEKTLRQVEEMKKQTIGVEVEMNNITRNKAQKL